MALTTNLEGYWKLDSDSSDATGNGHTGTDTSISYTSTNAVIVNAAQFGGSSKIKVPSAAGLTGTSQVSMTAWVYNTANWTGIQTLVAKIDAVGAGGTYIRMNVESGICHATSDGDTHTIIGGTALSTNTRYFVCMTYNGSTLSLYLNGTKDATDLSYAAAVTPGTGSLAFGELGDFNTAQFLAGGMMDEIGFWSRGLTSSEITQLYNSGNGLAYPFGATGHNLSLLGVGT